MKTNTESAEIGAEVAEKTVGFGVGGAPLNTDSGSPRTSAIPFAASAFSLESNRSRSTWPT